MPRYFRALFGIVCVVVLLVAAIPAQTPQAEPPQTGAEIAGLIGSDTEAQALVSGELKHLSGNRRIPVLARQIRPEWVPHVDGVEFLRLSDGDAEKHLANCETGGSYWVMSVNQLDGGMLEVTTSLKCGVSTHSVQFDRSEGQWRARRRGIGSGIVEVPPECECLRRRRSETNQ